MPDDSATPSDAPMFQTLNASAGLATISHGKTERVNSPLSSMTTAPSSPRSYKTTKISHSPALRPAAAVDELAKDETR